MFLYFDLAMRLYNFPGITIELKRKRASIPRVECTPGKDGSYRCAVRSTLDHVGHPIRCIVYILACNDHSQRTVRG